MSRGFKGLEVIRVGIVFAFDDSWLGGVNYFRNLLNAVYSDPQRKIEIVVFTGTHISHEKFEGFPNLKVVRNPFLSGNSWASRCRRLIKRIFRRDWVLERLLSKYQVDILSHSGWLGKARSIPAIGWIPDFQAFRLPAFFTKKELHSLSREFGYLSRYCSRILVSSHDAYNDLQQYLPEAKHKTSILNFALQPADEHEVFVGLEKLQEKYAFSEDFFLLPNQFWAHKNHRVVVDALAELTSKDLCPLVFCTGNTRDYRNPGFFDELMAYANSQGVADRFRVLGIIPYADLRSLMRYSLATINPSFFEGWSTSVEEAKAMSKALILSDIEVHREQNPKRAFYFSPNDPHKLAECLQLVSRSPEDFRVSVESAESEEIRARYMQFSKTYQEIVISTYATTGLQSGNSC